MPRYIISFNDGAMDHITEDEFPAVGDATRATMRDAKAAGVWIFGGGLQRQQATIVQTDGTRTNGPDPETRYVLGGFCILDVPTREDGLQWAARFADSCRCAQDVREIMYDPES